MTTRRGGILSGPNLNTQRRFSFDGPRATSQAVVIPVLLLLSLNFSPTGIVFHGAVPSSWLMVVLAATAASWVWFTVGGLALQRWCPEHSLSRTILLIVLFTTTEMLRTTLMHFLALDAGIVSEPKWAFRLVSGAATGLVTFGALSTVLNDLVAYRRAYRRLVEQRARLQTSLTTLATNLIATQAQILTSVRSRLEEALVVTLAETRKVVPNDISVVDDLFRVADEVVRPMSHQLFDVPVHFSDNSPDVKVPRARFSKVLIDVTKAPFRPGELGTLAALLSVPVIMLSASPLKAMMIFVALGLVFLITWIGRHFFTPSFGRLSLGWRIFCLSLVFAFPSAVLAVVVFNALETVGNSLMYFVGYGVLLGTLMGWLVTFTAGLGNARNAMLTEAASINNELYWLNVRAQSQLWVAQKNLAITLHNDVQTTLIAAALHLKQAMESGSAIQDAIPDVRRLLNKALDIGVGAAAERGPEDVLARVNDKWGGLIEASLTISSATTELVAHDTVCIRIFEDLLAEFMTNSVKHGQAKKVKVELSAKNERTLSLVMTNDGAPVDANRTSTGLGSRLLEALTLNHSVRDVPGGVRLTATIPIGTQVFAGADA